MILHDFKCNHCGKVFERMVKWDAERTGCPCGNVANRVFISKGEYRAQSFDPVLVFRDASGHYRYPGRSNETTPKGYEPVYLRTTPEVRKFEREINKKERERYFAHKERNERRFEQWIKNARSELRQKIQHMSPYGRDLARAAMEQGDREPSVNHRFDPAFRLEAFSTDASNREPQYDRDLQRRK